MKEKIFKILIADDDKETRNTLQAFLIQEGYHVETAEDGRAAFQKVSEWMPDMILLDVMMPKMDGQEMCRCLKQNQKYNFIHIIMMTEKAGSQPEESLSDKGADDYVSKPLDFPSLSACIRKKLRLVEKKQNATFDPLTRLYKRQVFEGYLKQERERIGNRGCDLAMILLEPSDLKKIQNTLERDMILRSFAQILRDETRKSDLAVRWSAAQMAILLPHTDRKGAELVAERLLRKIEKHEFPEPVHMTANLGIACTKKPEFDLVQAAEQALHHAKAFGCNKMVIL